MRLSALAVVCLLAGTAHAETELQNDGFNSGDAVGFEAGFVTGEIGASRFVAAAPGSALLKVHLLFGPDASGQFTVTLHVWDDTAGGATPGAELGSADFSLVGSSSAIQELDATPMNITLPQQFRIGIEFHHDGSPSIVRDTDGTIAQDKNYMLAQGLGWIMSSTAGLKGDWVIRAVISGGAAPDGGGTTGGSCAGNADCPVGNFCDLGAHTCTFDCRTDDDCGGGTCNSLGQCVGGEAGGCCETGSGGAASGGIVLLGLAVLGMVIRRRR